LGIGRVKKRVRGQLDIEADGGSKSAAAVALLAGILIPADHLANLGRIDRRFGSAKVVVTRTLEGKVGVIEDDTVVQTRVRGVGVLAVLVREPHHVAVALRAENSQIAQLTFLVLRRCVSNVILGSVIGVTTAAPQRQAVDRFVVQLAVQAELLPGTITQAAIGVDIVLSGDHAFLRTKLFDLKRSTHVQFQPAIVRVELRDIAQVATNAPVGLAGPVAVRAIGLRSRCQHRGQVAGLGIGHPQIGLKVHQRIAAWQVVVTSGPGIDFGMAQRILVNAPGAETENVRRHDLTYPPVVAAKA